MLSTTVLGFVMVSTIAQEAVQQLTIKIFTADDQYTRWPLCGGKKARKKTLTQVLMNIHRTKIRSLLLLTYPAYQ